MIRNEIYKLYGFAAGAFLLALSKYFFVGNAMLKPKYFVFEFISFALFLAIVYVFDRFIRESIKEKNAMQTQFKKLQDESEGNIMRLQKTIAVLRNEQNKDDNKEEISKLTPKIMAGLKECSSDKSFANRLLKNLSTVYEVGLAVCYLYDKPSEKFTVEATYGLAPDVSPSNFMSGEGLNGQAAADKEYRLIADVPEDYFNIESASGQAKPKHIYLLPIVKDDKSIGLIEIASFTQVNLQSHWSQLSESIVSVMNF